MLTEQPSEDRRQYIGGSDVAAILNVSPWTTAVDLWLEKTSETPPKAESEDRRRFFARRKRQEPVVAEMLADAFGVVVSHLSLSDHPNRYIDREHPFLRAEIDFEFLMSPAVRAHFPEREDFSEIPDRTVLNGECKTVHPFKASEWGEQGSEEVPIHYAAQVMHGLGVTRRPAALVAALFGLDTLLCFPVMADQETIADMRERCVRFWHDNVLARVPPEPVNLDDLSRLYTQREGRPVELDSSSMLALRHLSRLRYEEKRIKEEVDEARFKVEKYIGKAWDAAPDAEQTTDNAELRYQGMPVGSWRRQRGAYLDQKQLKTDHPEIIQQYTIERHSRILRIAKEVT